MIIMNEEFDCAVNTDNICYYKVVKATEDYVLRAYFDKEDSILLARGARQYLLNLISDIAENSETESYMEIKQASE